jgi:hypothetical protein
LVTGIVVAAGVHYATKKRPDGSSIADDLKAKAPEWMNKAQPYLNQIKEQFSKLTQRRPDAGNTTSYPEKFNNLAPDPDPTYSS